MKTLITIILVCSVCHLKAHERVIKVADKVFPEHVDSRHLDLRLSGMLKTLRLLSDRFVVESVIQVDEGAIIISKIVKSNELLITSVFTDGSIRSRKRGVKRSEDIVLLEATSGDGTLRNIRLGGIYAKADKDVIITLEGKRSTATYHSKNVSEQADR